MPPTAPFAALLALLFGGGAGGVNFTEPLSGNARPRFENALAVS